MFPLQSCLCTKRSKYIGRHLRWVSISVSCFKKLKLFKLFGPHSERAAQKSLKNNHAIDFYISCLLSLVTVLVWLDHPTWLYIYFSQRSASTMVCSVLLWYLTYLDIIYNCSTTCVCAANSNSACGSNADRCDGQVLLYHVTFT